MKYMLLIYHEEQSWEGVTEAERQQVYAEYQTLIGELASRGQFVSGSELQPVSTATTVRVRDGKEMITDGPFAETHEQLGGYFLIEAENLDQATSIAARGTTLVSWLPIRSRSGTVFTGSTGARSRLRNTLGPPNSWSPSRRRS